MLVVYVIFTMEKVFVPISLVFNFKHAITLAFDFGSVRAVFRLNTEPVRRGSRKRRRKQSGRKFVNQISSRGLLPVSMTCLSGGDDEK